MPDCKRPAQLVTTLSLSNKLSVTSANWSFMVVYVSKDDTKSYFIFSHQATFLKNSVVPGLRVTLKIGFQF